MNTLKFTVAKTSTGFDAYYEKNGTIVAITTGETIAELKNNALEAYNLYAEEAAIKLTTMDKISFEFDLPSFFEYYPVISARALSARVGINNSLLSQYVTGVKKPSPKQVQRILTEVKNIGKELSELELV
ncbi:helix-turn-helix transcriptional regulator [Mucilaginibacter corticis]|uniref:Helix-turn-helix transcriptional regulator n=1 Tax=Mucilaginibacter corticis TaxID=2597670 RepID=A0A556MVJ9_9SPHI|nr:helix-turn-helix transcriptional regulator [Mucilaginibacter corticis]TSJ43892.1 helix-turn-helix transcriptional regulator [Mucilaginibacter corticis]